MMKRLQGRFCVGALVWSRWVIPALALSLVSGIATAQSVRLVPAAERYAGTGSAQDSGPANSTILAAPEAVAADVSGNVYIADTGNNCIRKVDSSTVHSMTVLVGQPVSGGSDTCQNASSVTASDPTTGVLNPYGVAVDSGENVFIADTGHNCVRRLAGGDTGGTADLVTVAGTCGDLTSASVTPQPSALALDHHNNLYIAVNDSTDSIYQVLESKYPSYGSVCVVSGPLEGAESYCTGVTLPATVTHPLGLAVDPLGNLYIADAGNRCVRQFNGSATTTAVGQCVNDGTGSSTTALQSPVSVAVDAAGHLYISDSGAAQVFELISGALSAVAGNGVTGPYDSTTQDGQAAATIPLDGLAGLATDRSGNVYLAEQGNNIVRLLQEGLTFPTTGVRSESQLQVLQFVISNAVNLTASVGSDYLKLNDFCSGSHVAPTPGTPETCLMSFYFAPTLPGLRNAPLRLTDTSTSPATVYSFGLNGIGQSAEAIFWPGTINTLAQGIGAPNAVALDGSGNVFFTESGSGIGSLWKLAAGSSTPTELVSGGMLSNPTALTLDAAGNVYIADSIQNAVFRYDINGNLSMVAAGLDNPVALAIDQLGDLYVAQDLASDESVIEIYAGGQVAVIAGKGAVSGADGVPATSARFVHPSALYLDPSGNLYVGDRGAYRVYYIDVTGTIHRFAGNGTATDAANPKAKTDFGLAGITGISADPAGDIYIADSSNNRVVLIFSGLAANPQAAVLTGGGAPGYTGDGGPANKATLDSPMAVTVNGSADVFIADSGNSALREITYTQPTLNFGTVKLGQTAGPLGTTLWNAGNSTLAPVAPILDDTVDFAADSTDSNCSSSMPAGSTCDLFYTFTPKAPGSYVKHANLTDSSSTATQIITLLATVPPPPVATVTVTPVTVVYGNSYTLAATITGNQGAGDEPTGTVTFSIGGSTLCAAQSLPTNGAISCSPSPTLEDVGTYQVTVSYSGDTTYPAATAIITLIVTPRPVTITADDKTRPINTPNPTLTGTVVNVVPGQSITATYSTTAVTASPAGTYPISPAYTFGPGTKASNYTVTVVKGTLTVTASSNGGGGGTGGGTSTTTGSFTLAAGPTEQEIDHSGTVHYTVSLGSTSGFNGPVGLACSGLPEGASCSFSPASVTLTSGGNGTAVMTITATADTSNVPTIFSQMRNVPAAPTSNGTPLLAWTMLPIGLFGSGGLLLRRRRLLMLLVPLALLAAALGMTGCAGPSNYKIYTVTVTGTATSGGATVTRSSTVDFVLAR